MSKTNIEWTGYTLNPFVGCSKCSPACQNCFAERFAARLAKNPKMTAKYAGVVDGKGHWTGKISDLDLSCFDKLPKKPSRVFVGSMIVFKGLNGGSCPECHGTGMIGGLKEVQNIPMNGDKEFGNLLRKIRERRLISMSDLAVLLKCKVSRISEIELGMTMPIDKERSRLQSWIEQE